MIWVLLWDISKAPMEGCGVNRFFSHQALGISASSTWIKLIQMGRYLSRIPKIRHCISFHRDVCTKSAFHNSSKPRNELRSGFRGVLFLFWVLLLSFNLLALLLLSWVSPNLLKIHPIYLPMAAKGHCYWFHQVCLNCHFIRAEH